eukprot:5800889-Ditylum_brightwellii.AAC.1
MSGDATTTNDIATTLGTPISSTTGSDNANETSTGMSGGGTCKNAPRQQRKEFVNRGDQPGSYTNHLNKNFVGNGPKVRAVTATRSKRVDLK